MFGNQWYCWAEAVRHNQPARFPWQKLAVSFLSYSSTATLATFVKGARIVGCKTAVTLFSFLDNPVTTDSFHRS